MKKEKSKKSKSNDENLEFSLLDVQEIELLKQQIIGAVLGILAELKFYKASYEEICEIRNKYLEDKDDYINSNRTYLESAQLFLISQSIFTKVSFQFYYLILQDNIENNTYEDLSSEVNINISCILNLLGNIYFLLGIQQAIDRENNNPIVGD